ncbi:response regulator transcription factor [uncultured Faecalicoccus sp.]|uniref:response regulator transcription factor n=1 Tax=uncultured Faecalicoccus sp. TaxID=1971760 RepID=UPI002589E0D3|nr:response regulator transcription factor [uncultured Faecalicoccus sp.]
MPYKIMIAEDDEDIAELIALYLENDDFQVVQAQNGKEALERFEQMNIDLLIVDLMMPEINGYETIRKIREVSQIPILILSAKSMNQDKVLGLGIGADMYMTKPFDPLELVAQVKAMIRRSYRFSNLGQEPRSFFLKRGDLVYDPEKMCVKKAGKEISLTAYELKILVAMMKAPGRVFTRLQLYQVISRDFCQADEDTIMVHISRIRSKIEEDPSKPKYIKTVRGLGYRFDDEAA